MRDLGITGKVQSALDRSAYDALVIVGADNVQYIGGAPLPFAPYRPGQCLLVSWPRAGQPACICPSEWEATIRNQGWVGDVRPYPTAGDSPMPAVHLVAQHLQELAGRGATVALDMARATPAFVAALQAALPAARLVACDRWLAELRIVKTPVELALLEEIADKTDHGINGAIHHVVVERFKTQLTLAEDIRVHCLERGLDLRGYGGAAQVACGEAATSFWPLAPKYGYSGTEALDEGQMVRMSMRGYMAGYWSDASRMMVMGPQSDAQAAAYGQLVVLREAVIARLKPGVRCSQVFDEVAAEAKQAGIDFIAELGLGHGIGASLCEPPYLSGSDDTVLAAGMVLVLDPVVCGPDREIMRSKDTVIITEAGCRVIGWYRDWREPYIPIQAI
jgi:Xaa-Pro aminopeptidase